MEYFFSSKMEQTLHSPLLWVPRTLSSSSFIEPPATGHHQWSGARKNIFNIFFYRENKQYNGIAECRESGLADGRCEAQGPLSRKKNIFELLFGPFNFWLVLRFAWGLGVRKKIFFHLKWK